MKASESFLKFFISTNFVLKYSITKRHFAFEEVQNCIGRNKNLSREFIMSSIILDSQKIKFPYIKTADGSFK